MCIRDSLDDISEKPDFIILDPPRDGIHPKALRKIIDYGVENIVYKMCIRDSLPLEGKLIGFLLITNDSLGDVVKSDKTEILFGTDSFTEEILGLHFKISPFSFFQTNSKGAEVLYSRAREYILADSSFEQEQKSELLGKTPDRKYIDTFDKEESNNSSFDERVDHESSVKNHFVNEDSLKDKVVFDLYSGTGTIAQIIAPIAKKVIGVEIVAEAVEAAKENAAANGLTNCESVSYTHLDVYKRQVLCK